MIPLIEFNPTATPQNAYSKTFYINYEKNRIQGEIDGLEAIKQSIISMLSTERYAYLIHTWQYGATMEKYIGENIDFILSDIGREIKETLLTDNRILDVREFEYNQFEPDSLRITFLVDTIYGSANLNTNIAL